MQKNGHQIGKGGKVNISPLTPGFAGAVTGIDCRRPLTAAQVQAIEAGMDRFAVLVFHDQPFQDDEQLHFAAHFGELERGGYGTARIHFRTEQEVRPLAPGIGDFSNIDAQGTATVRTESSASVQTGGSALAFG